MQFSSNSTTLNEKLSNIQTAFAINGFCTHYAFKQCSCELSLFTKSIWSETTFARTI